MTYRGFLLHLTHYDPLWFKEKKKERRFDRKTAEACVTAAAESGMNMLIVDIADAVIYRGLPHCRKPYSVPMKELEHLAGYARSLGLDVVPKLNFSKSPQHRHSHWLWHEQRPADSEARWKEAFRAMDEVIAATRPSFFHVGMDEDDTRSPDEYARALLKLHRALAKRKLRMMMWADCGHPWRPAERWKVIPAVRQLPRDTILMPWNYHAALEDWTRKFTRWGFDVIGTCSYGAPRKTKGARPDPLQNAREWSAAVRRCRAAGMLLTRWIPCRRANRDELVEAIRRCGQVFAEA